MAILHFPSFRALSLVVGLLVPGFARSAAPQAAAPVPASLPPGGLTPTPASVAPGVSAPGVSAPGVSASVAPGVAVSVAPGVSASVAPGVAVSVAPGVAVSVPFVVPACDAAAWPAPPGSMTTAVPVRVTSGTEPGGAPWFELLLPPETKPAPAGQGVAPDAVACLWIDPAGPYTNQSGVSTGVVSGAAAPHAPDRPPQASRFHRLTVSPCEGAASAGACVRLEKVPDLQDAPGRIPALLRLPGRETPIALVLHRTPNYGLLIGCMSLGLAAAFFVTLWGPKFSSQRDRRRRLRQLDGRRAASDEDFMPLLNRVDALLDMCRARVDHWLASVGVLIFDESLLDDRLLEAAQLLTLSEEKTRCWQQSQAVELPPSVETEVAELLRGFDAEVFLAGLPVRTDPAKPKAWYPQPLQDALARVHEVGSGFYANLAAAIQQALTATSPPPLPGQVSNRLAQLLTEIDALASAQLLALAPFQGKTGVELKALAPRTVRAVDARLNVWRAAAYYRESLRNGTEPDETHVRKLREGLADWAARDLTGPIHGRPDLPALRVLQWSVDNERTLTHLRQVLGGNLAADSTPTPAHLTAPPVGSARPNPLLSSTCADVWRIFEPASLELRLHHPLSSAYVWRQNIRVTWRVEALDSGAAGSLRFAGAESREVAGATLHECASGRATAYATQRGRFKVRPISVSFRDPLTGKFGESVPLADNVATDRVVTVKRNPEASWVAGVGAAQLIRFVCTGTLSITTGLVFVDGLFSNAQGWAVYAQAFAWAFGIDLATVALRGGWTTLQGVLSALPVFRRVEPPPGASA